MNEQIKKVAVLGGTGFVGGYLCSRLAAAGHEITLLTRNAEQAKSSQLLPRTRLVELDVYDRKALTSALRGHQVVINLVGILNERGFSGKRYVHMSALRAGEGKSHYQRSRGEAEKLVRNSTLDWTIMQPSVIFGRGDSFLNRFASLLKMMPVLPLACPHARFQPVWVEDVAQAFVSALEREDSIGQSYALAGPETFSLKEIVQLVCTWLGIRRWIVGLPRPLSWLQGQCMDFVPGKPFSSDNYRSLQIDSVLRGDNGLTRLDIAAHALTAIAPDYIGGSRRRKMLSLEQRTARR
jgi:uncharacterized protein YbjT (DUF2867 family)